MRGRMRSRIAAIAATLIVVAGAGIVATGSASADASAGTLGMSAMPGMGPATGQAHQSQLDPVRNALAVYADFGGAARLADYPTGPVPKVSGPQAGQTCIVDPAGSGAMGEHYVNLANVTDGTIDAMHPEALIYEPHPDGSRVLVGVEYIVFQSQWNATHHSPPRLFGQTFMSFDASNPFGLPAYYALHAWLWRADPSGTFAMYNPAVHCP
ncbi:hypothetical protein [Microbacterium candidum]|uniref:Uncharacterized protein n=1 Tax=Microbacterium candidum TaxID=3041922 RepID=A0ABT7N319_9MICO|nr:hypothetical protein [Microbacterium sp. ASV49]MDL9981061.1 hypothetical protein [Microbacterium sp. ASV49]